MPLPTYLMSNFPSVRPSLNLQFDSQPTPEDMTSHLASVGATFSRASIGTYTDANGLVAEASAGQARPNYSTAGVHEGLLIEESRVNLVKTSEDFSAIDWIVSSAGTGSNPVVTINQAIAPDGTASADKIFFDVGAGTTSSDQSLIGDTISITSGVDYTGSIWLKGESGGEQLLFRHTAGTYDLLTLTTEWQRFDYTQTSATTSYTFEMAIRQNVSGHGVINSSATVYAWGAQLEAGSFPTSYIPTIPTFSSRASTATYFDSNGVLQTQAIQTSPTGVGRTDHKYIDGQWVEAGLLLEASATNETTNSEGALATGGTRLSRDGTVVTFFDGDSVNAYATNGTAGSMYIYENKGSSLTGSTTYTTSLFVKIPSSNPYSVTHVDFQNVSNSYGTTTKNVFDLVNGTIVSSASENATIEQFPNGWYRISITDTTSSSPSSFDWLLYPLDGSTSADTIGSTGDAEDVLYVYAVQTEEGSQPTSYIPTSGATADRSADVYTTATKTRSADVCYIDGTAFTDFYNQEQGTYFVKFNNVNDLSTSSYILNSDDGTTDERIYLLYGSGGTGNLDFRVQDNGSNAFSDNIGTIAENATYKVAIRIKASDYRGILDGTDVSTDTYNDVPDITTVYIGSRGGISHINGKINKFIYFPRGLSNNELIKLTQ